MLKISYKQHISNKDILVSLNVRPQLMKMIKKQSEEILHIFLEKKDVMGRGRPRNTWFSNIRDWMGIDYAPAALKAQDCDQWQSAVSKVLNGYGTHDWIIVIISHAIR